MGRTRIASKLKIILGTAGAVLLMSLSTHAAAVKIKVQNPQTIYFMKDGAVEATSHWLPAGIEILLVNGGQTDSHTIREKNGKLIFSSSGFVLVDTIGIELALPKGTPIYISALVVQDQDNDQNYKSLKKNEDKKLSIGYLRYYNSAGKPNRSYTQSLQRKFKEKLNKGVEQNQLTPTEHIKWIGIYSEIKQAVNRETETAKKYFVVPTAEAILRSIAFEKNKTVFIDGAWSIAVQGTAKRHGFANVPCAEFVSEVVRQAYKRAGYSHFQDFNDEKKNRLDFKNNAAAVIFLAEYLYKAGWIPWNAAEFEPPVGALMMHTTATYPGHTYIVAGNRGQWIIDNAMPQGRDLRETSEKVLGMMYEHGVFFLPPGVNPKPW